MQETYYHNQGDPSADKPTQSDDSSEERDDTLRERFTLQQGGDILGGAEYLSEVALGTPPKPNPVSRDCAGEELLHDYPVIG